MNSLFSEKKNWKMNCENNSLKYVTENKLITLFDFEKFEDFTFVGRGTFCTVRRAYSKELRKHVALKRVDDKLNEGFMIEASKYNNSLNFFVLIN